MSTEVKQLVDDLNRDFIAFKAANDAGNKTLADRIEKGINDIEEKIAAIQTAQNRSALHDGVKEFTSAKDMVKAAKSAEFRDFLRKGGHASEFEFKADATTSTTNGVFPIVDQLVGRLIHDSSPLASLVDNITIGNGAPYTKIFNKNDAGAARIAETGTRSDTGANSTYKVEIKAPEVYGFHKVSLAAIEDSFYDVEGEVLWSCSDKIARLIAAELISGTGFSNDQSVGILTGTEQAVTGVTSVNRVDRLNVVAGLDDTTISLEDLINLEAALPAIYLPNAAFLANRKTMALLRKLKSGDNYIWEPSTQAGQPSRILGYPVYPCVDMPDVAAGAKSVLFGDFKQGGTLVTRVGVSLTKDLMKNPGYVTSYLRARLGFAPTDGRALVCLEQLSE